MEKATKNLISELDKIVKPILQDAGLELVEIELKGSGARRILRIYIDSEDGVTIEDCAKVSEEVSVHLDMHDPLESSYVLEVSSPGLDRPLRKERDFRRCIGKKLRVVLNNSPNDMKELVGKVKQVENGVITIMTGKKEMNKITMRDIYEARIQF